MTRKRFEKLLLGHGFQRNEAHCVAEAVRDCGMSYTEILQTILNNAEVYVERARQWQTAKKM